MADESKDLVFRQRDAQTKLDYFILGADLAMLAFTVQYAERGPFTWLLVPTWGLLLASFFGGIFRQERNLVYMGQEALRDQILRQQQMLLSAIQVRARMIDPSTGQLVSPETIEKDRANLEESIKIVTEGREKAGKWGEKMYNVQVRCLLAGLALYAIYRTLWLFDP